MWRVENDEVCDICGKPALLILDADKPCPWHLCEDHMPQKWRELFRRAEGPMEPWIVCGGRSVIREIDLASVTLNHYCARHAPAEDGVFAGAAPTRH